MRRTEFYTHLAREGKGRFKVLANGQVRAEVIEQGRITIHDPLSFVAWKLHKLDAPGEIDRPARVLQIKNPLRLTLASDLARGYVGSTRRAILAALKLAELPPAAITALLAVGGAPINRYEAVPPYDPDARRVSADEDSDDWTEEEPEPDEEPEGDDDGGDAGCDCDACREARGES
jgi:hypothetical protein